jgi:Holliday junction DNA helicase RuvA
VAIASGRALPGDARSEANHALAALGYKPQEVSRMVHAVIQPEMDAEEIIRLALQSVIKK